MHLFILPVWDCTSNFKTEDQTFDQVKQYTNQINRQIKTQWRRTNKLISARREIGIYRMSFAFGPSDHFAHLEHAQLAVLINLCWCTSSSQRRKKKSSKKQKKKKHLNLNDNRCVKHTATIKKTMRCVTWANFWAFFQRTDWGISTKVAFDYQHNRSKVLHIDNDLSHRKSHFSTKVKIIPDPWIFKHFSEGEIWLWYWWFYSWTDQVEGKWCKRTNHFATTSLYN